MNARHSTGARRAFQRLAVCLGRALRVFKLEKATVRQFFLPLNGRGIKHCVVLSRYLRFFGFCLFCPFVEFSGDDAH